jgi:hypothetical protein
MSLKDNKANVTIELLVFFLIISFSVWTGLGIFELYKLKSNLDKVSYLAAQQIAFDETKKEIWQNPSFLVDFAKVRSITELEVLVSCENNICKNGNAIFVDVSGKNLDSIINLKLNSKAVAISNKFSDDK